MCTCWLKHPDPAIVELDFRVVGLPSPSLTKAGGGFCLEKTLVGRSKSKKNRAVAAAPSPEALERFKQAGVAVGYDPDTMQRLAARCQGRAPSARGRRLDDVELLSVIEGRLASVLEYFDDHTLGKMSGRDLVVAAGILTDKRQLLRGEPTAITRFQDIRKMDEILEAVAKELKRRGKVIDVTPEKDAASAPVANAGNGSVP